MVVGSLIRLTVLYSSLVYILQLRGFGRLSDLGYRVSDGFVL